jgi:hypothetical protein
MLKSSIFFESFKILRLLQWTALYRVRLCCSVKVILRNFS